MSPRYAKSSTLPEEPWWKIYLIWGIIVASVITAIAVVGVQTSKDQKLASYLTFARDTKAYFCDIAGQSETGAVMDYRAYATQREQEWEAYVASKNLVLTINRGLNFFSGDQFIRNQCDSAKALLQQAKAAVTEDEKVSSYEATDVFRTEAGAQAHAMADKVYAYGIFAIDTYALAAQYEASRMSNDITITNMILSRESLSRGEMDAVVMYANRAIEQYILQPEPTPTP